jgi:arylsulfatase A-like enzyme
LERFPLDSIEVPDWFRGDAARFREREQKSLAMVAWLDEGIAALEEKLRAAGELEDTLFVFWIDNGWANGLVSKGSAFDKGLRTPFILRWERGIPGGQRFPALVSPVDLHATLLDYAGLAPRADCQGRSLRPCIEGKPWEPRPALYGALYPYTPGQADSSAERDAYALWARTEHWKYVLTLRDIRKEPRLESGEDDERDDIKAILVPYPERARGDEELYDLERDPYELENLAAAPEQAQLCARFRGEILAWWKATGGGPLDVP